MPKLILSEIRTEPRLRDRIKRRLHPIQEKVRREVGEMYLLFKQFDYESFLTNQAGWCKEQLDKPCDEPLPEHVHEYNERLRHDLRVYQRNLEAYQNTGLPPDEVGEVERVSPLIYEELYKDARDNTNAFIGRPNSFIFGSRCRLHIEFDERKDVCELFVWNDIETRNYEENWEKLSGVWRKAGFATREISK